MTPLSVTSSKGPILSGQEARIVIERWYPTIVCESCAYAFVYGSVYVDDKTNELVSMENIWAKFCPACGARQSWDGKGKEL